MGGKPGNEATNMAEALSLTRHNGTQNLYTDLSSAAVSGSEPQANLLNVLKQVTPHYQSLGIQLGISLDKIKEFERNSAGRRTVQDCFEEMLGLWLREGDCKLDTLVKGLVQIDQRRLAGCLKERYRGKFSEKLCLCV